MRAFPKLPTRPLVGLDHLQPGLLPFLLTPSECRQIATIWSMPHLKHGW